MNILRIYDNGGKTMDRYCVVFDVQSFPPDYGYGNPKLKMCLCMSNDQGPRGVCMTGDALLGRHLGKLISYQELPIQCQKSVKAFLLD